MVYIYIYTRTQCIYIYTNAYMQYLYTMHTHNVYMCVARGSTSVHGVNVWLCGMCVGRVHKCTSVSVCMCGVCGCVFCVFLYVQAYGMSYVCMM